MKTVAAILVETGKPLVFSEVEIPVLKSGQVLVEIAFSSVCHTQVLECRGYRGEDGFLPHCLGHEGSGVVREVGPGVRKVKSGDRVILSWMKGNGAEVSGTTYLWNGKVVNAGAVTTFGRDSIISENRLTQLSDNISMREATLLGCAIPTGVGVVLNTAQPKAGQSMAIFGVGGIGLCAVAAATLSGCTPIIAVDIRDDKLDYAKVYGATHCVNSKRKNPVDDILQICPGGVDFAVEATGVPQVINHALRSVRNQGGTAVVVGNARHGEQISLDPWQFNLGKRLLGTWGGDNAPDRDFPRYCKLLEVGKLKLDPYISKTYRLEDLNDAIDDLENGNALRPLIDMKSP